MRTHHGTLLGDQIVEDDLTLFGIISGNILVKTGSNLVIHGIVNGDITLESAAHLIVYGIVKGQIDILNAEAEIYGIATHPPIMASGGRLLAGRGSIIAGNEITDETVVTGEADRPSGEPG